ncbi:MAG: hypothetical protein HY318_16515 [Armatimonadetes bacterium]|nr:hypothetical protein [Armatimonadota bacterium]
MHKASLLMGAICGALLSPPAVEGASIVLKGVSWSSLSAADNVSQHALISYRAGRERMYISANVPCTDKENILWLFSVPAPPRDISVEVAPWANLSPASPPDGVLRHAMWYCQFATQWSHFFFLFPNLSLDILGNGLGMRGLYIRVNSGGGTVETSASVFQAMSTYDLQRELRTLQVEINSQHLRAFEPYQKDDYSIVAVRAKPGKECYLLLEFPSRRCFYPLLSEPSSGGNYIQITGIQELHPASGSIPRTTRSFGVPDSLCYAPNRGNTWKWGRTFTMFSCGSLPASESGDLWFRPYSSWCASLWLACLWALGQRTFLFPIVFLLVACFCYLSGGLAGVVLFREWRTFARLGLWNLLSIAALALAVFTSHTINHWVGEDRSWSFGSRLRFLLTFSAIFLVTTEALWWSLLVLVNRMR